MALTIVGRTSLEMRDAQLGVYIFISLSLSLSLFLPLFSKTKQNYTRSAEKRPGCPRDWQEGLIYQNLFSLPFFVLAGSNLSSAARVRSSDAPGQVSLI